VVGPMYSGIMMDHGLMNILFISVFVVMIGITISLSVIVYRSKNIDTAGQA